ncbi:KR domain-containing protein [Acidipropionibacterium jensenii]|uniref:SDR family NAD(P)-dependent oxidoreductase n=1 Tax=Acidipropionibacterium jensenii TaxID=1749 RepID=UPI000BC30EFC|nr:SDR family NAD(P)-dependent oxidoreductase [Acidipropionibacterium jensenii]AZZ43027.1 KR domain-containing protein [Acidipropionibacterium jensenii]
MSSCLVTGGTSGIGREFITQLAARGDDVIIAARDVDRMAAIKAEIEPRYGVSVETIRADLAVRADVDVVAARLEDPDRPVDLLVNNAGFGLHAKILDPETLPLQEKAFDVMCRAVLILSAAAGRAMRDRGHGGIINVASSSAWINTGNYSAIKAWVLTFTEGLANELHGSGVKVEALCPGWVHTEFHFRAHVTATNLPEVVWVDAKTLVRESLSDLAKGKVVSVPTARWKAAIAVAGVVPRSTMRWLSRNLTSSRDKTDFPAPHPDGSSDHGPSGEAGER